MNKKQKIKNWKHIFDQIEIQKSNIRLGSGIEFNEQQQNTAGHSNEK